MHACVTNALYLYRACSAFGHGEGDIAQIPSPAGRCAVHARVIMTKCDWPFLDDNMPPPPPPPPPPTMTFYTTSTDTLARYFRYICVLACVLACVCRRVSSIHSMLSTRAACASMQLIYLITCLCGRGRGPFRGQAQRAHVGNVCHM